MSLSKTLKHYFESELRILYEEGEHFSNKHPESAAFLNFNALKGKDPHIERLLEGVAFLNAHLKEKIEEDLPEIAETLIRQLCPELLQPLPSQFIAQFSHKAAQPASYFFPKGTGITSQELGPEKTALRFQLLSDLYYVPLNLCHVSQVSTKKQSILRFGFQLAPNVEPSTLSSIQELSLYLLSDPELRSQIFYILLNCVQSVSLKYFYKDQAQTIKIGDQSCIKPGFNDNLNNDERDKIINGHSKISSFGFEYLINYFAFKEKHFFVQIENPFFHHLPEGMNQFEIEIIFELPHSVQHLDFGHPFNILGSCVLRKEYFQLNCVPVINFYKTMAEPISITNFNQEYPVIPCAMRPYSIKVAALDRVQSVFENQHIPALYNLNTFSTVPASQYYTFREKISGEYDHPRLFISIGGKNVKVQDKVSCSIIAYNGNYPREYLQSGTLKASSAQIPNSFTITNLTNPTACTWVSREPGFLWTLLSFLSINLEALAFKENLQKCLKLMDWSRDKENIKKINAIKETQVKSFNTIYRGAFLRGLEYHITLEESGFINLGDLYLFGTVLNQFLTYRIPMNHLLKTIIHCDPSEMVLNLNSEPGLQCPI